MNTEKQRLATIPVGSVILILAIGVMVTGAAIPFFAPSLRDAPWTDDPQVGITVIAGNPGAYAWANGLFLITALLTALGLVALSLEFGGPGRPWAMMGVGTFAFAAMSECIDRIISMQVFTWGAVQGFSIADPLVQVVLRFQGGLSDMFTILAFAALSLFGIALLRRSRPSALGWILVAGGVAGIVLHLLGGGIPAYVYSGTAALGVFTWLLGRTEPATNGG